MSSTYPPLPRYAWRVGSISWTSSQDDHAANKVTLVGTGSFQWHVVDDTPYLHKLVSPSKFFTKACQFWTLTILQLTHHSQKATSQTCITHPLSLVSHLHPAVLQPRHVGFLISASNLTLHSLFMYFVKLPCRRCTSCYISLVIILSLAAEDDYSEGPVNREWRLTWETMLCRLCEGKAFQGIEMIEHAKIRYLGFRAHWYLELFP